MPDDAQTDPETSPEPGAPAGPAAPAPTAPAADAGTLLRTSPRKGWLIKVLIITAACAAFGTWGLVDAVWLYPARGERYAQWAEGQYLVAAQRVRDQGEDRGIFDAEDLSVADPAAELRVLNETLEELREASGSETHPRHFRASMDLAKRDWLIGLDRIGELRAERTTYSPDPADPRYPPTAVAELSAARAESPLAVYDLPFQWAIMAVCYGFTAYLLLLVVRVSVTKYAWRPAEARLYLPGDDPSKPDAGLVPDDLESFDKRKWDQFIVFLGVRADHPTHGGREIKFDTYRHDRIEDWLLEMERVAFPDEDEPGPAPAGGEGDRAATPAEAAGDDSD